MLAVLRVQKHTRSKPALWRGARFKTVRSLRARSARTNGPLGCPCAKAVQAAASAPLQPRVVFVKEVVVRHDCELHLAAHARSAGVVSCLFEEAGHLFRLNCRDWTTANAHDLQHTRVLLRQYADRALDSHAVPAVRLVSVLIRAQVGRARSGACGGRGGTGSGGTRRTSERPVRRPVSSTTALRRAKNSCWFRRDRSQAGSRRSGRAHGTCP